MADAAPGGDACVAAQEVCDGADNDCDGDVDEGFNLQSDPANCGTCGNACNLSGSAGTCSAGTCSFACLPNFHDLNMDLNMPGSNGCEYGPCTDTGAEVCNLSDDDCDNKVDEDLNLDADTDNCGSCFNKCQAVNVENNGGTNCDAEGECCNAGQCGYDRCQAGFADIDQDMGANFIRGCEYTCPVFPPLSQEECNGKDDDCDGIIDELPIAGLGADCGPASPGDTGECSWGVQSCVLGVPTCTGYQGPTAETCDGLDNDCDSSLDEDFDKDNDPNNCGPTCTVCNIANAVNGCSSGACTIITCLPGFEDANGMLSDGCEYACTRTGPEICDGQDNDCDNKTDEGLTPPAGLCNGNGPCSGTTAQCTDCAGSGPTQWRCIYTDSRVETDSCGDVVLQETLCNAEDGDCDGLTDEAFPTLNQACNDGGIGICRGTGTYICDSGDPTQVTCDITSPGQTPLANELCNNLDDDCDNTVDEMATDEVVVITTAGSPPSFTMDKYEASRPDATASSPGSAEHRACSEPGRMPWTNLTWMEAEAACIAAGKRLCTQAEWQYGCGGAASSLYPYGNTYDPLACNGYDFDRDCTAPNDNEEPLSTGFSYECPAVADTCVSADGVYDLSGNVKEWTGEAVPMGSNNRRVLGGAFNTVEQGLTCTYEFLVFDETIALPSVGFRCCQ